MADILDAELAPSGTLKTGWIDLGEHHLFRDIWVVVFYLGLMLPHAFLGYWIAKVALFEQNLSIADFTFAIMLIKAPFIFVLIWAQPVERWSNLAFGRRRTWIIAGLGLHIVLLVPLFILGANASVLVLAAVLAIALIPRLMAEAAVAGMMVESIPKLGRFNSGINLAYRGGGHVFLILMGWLVGSFGSSPLMEAGILDTRTLFLVGMAVAMVTAIIGLAITFVMKEGKAIRGPRSQPKREAAPTIAKAMEDPNLDFPETATFTQKLLASMRTRTSWVVLLLCFLMPLGDGFEGMFALFLRDDLGFDVAQATLFANATIFAAYLGLLGPWISDHIGRQKMLRLSAQASIVCYLGLALMMLAGVGATPILILWFPTLMVTDWLIFTFITTWAEVSDPRLPVTHMAVYKTVHTVAANFIWFGLAAFIVVISGDEFWLIFLLACIGPFIGLRNFEKFKLGDDYGEDPIDIGERVQHYQSKLPTAFTIADGKSPAKAALVVCIAGLVLSVALFTGPFVLLNWESEETKVSWDLEEWNSTMITFETVSSLTTSVSVLATIDVPTTEGGVLIGLFRVDQEASQCPLDTQWTTTFNMPDRGNFSDGTNESSFIANDWEGEMGIDFDAEGPNLTGFSSEESLRVRMEQIQREVWWGHGRGSWTLKVEMTGTDCAGLGSATFRVNVTAEHLIMPSTNPADGMVNVTSLTTVTQHDYGEAVGVLLGFPILLATPVFAWIAGRDPEALLA